MLRFFGFGKEEPAAPKAPSLQEASSKIDLNIQQLEAKIAKCDEEIRANVAKGAGNATAKQRAMHAMQRKKNFEKQKEQLLGTQFNVETLAFQQEQAEAMAMSVQALQAGQEQLKESQGGMNSEKVAQMMDDVADLNAEGQAVQDALAQQPIGMSGVEDDELQAEFERIQAEEALMKLAGVPGVSEAGYSTVTPAAAAPIPDSAVQDEYLKLLASMGAAPTAVPTAA